MLAICLPMMVSLSSNAATPTLPKHNLTVELRQIEEGAASGYVVGTKSGEPLITEQVVTVRNGEKASLLISKTMALQWVQSVSAQSATLKVPGASVSTAGGGVNNAIVLMRAGQTFKVKPNWPGGRQPASVEIEVQSANVAQRSGAELPDQKSVSLTTTLNLPLGQWVTVAISGSSPQTGMYSSQSSSANPRLLQIRVQVP